MLDDLLCSPVKSELVLLVKVCADCRQVLLCDGCKGL